MNPVTQLLVLLPALLVEAAGGVDMISGYCIDGQCFTAFRDVGNFDAAREQCLATHGHLMTVRTSVSHDVLNILLGNLTGSFWIGLHLPAGCPDSAAKLRGFQWVTKGSESDFSNWPSSFDPSCASPLCVSVSPGDGFLWSPGECEKHAGGFVCEYTFSDGCRPLEAPPGGSVAYRTPFGLTGDDLLSLPPGSTAVQHPPETKYICSSGLWQQAPWTCEILAGGCEHKCAADPRHVFFCYCPPGETVNPANGVTCEEAPADEACAALRCEHACYKVGHVRACACNSGWRLAADGRSCVDVGGCGDARQCPEAHTRCVDVPGGFKCVCEAGYEMSGGRCVDADECASGPCEHECHNTPGSYRCSCFDGFIVDPESPTRCKRFCGMEECPAECDPNNKFQCYCPDGYLAEERGDRVFCLDIDECVSNFCDQDCTNTFGSFKCACFRGYTLINEYTCVKSEDEGSGGTPSATVPTAVHVTTPGPTRRPSGVSAGGLVGIIICTAVFIVLVVFLAERFFSRRRKTASSVGFKSAEGEAQGLRQVTSGDSEKWRKEDM